MKALTQHVNRVVGYVCALLFALLVATTVWQVFSRLVLDSPVTWSEELAKILFVWLSFLGSAYVYGERGHMAVEFLARRFPNAVERLLALGTHVAALLFAVIVLVWGGANAAANAWSQNLTALPTTIGVVYVVIPIAGVAFVFYTVSHLIAISTGQMSTYPIPDSERVVAEGEEIAENTELVTEGEMK
ncbi:TRAP transporter small permease [Arcanobacterium haemolyticum]|uniref:Tripartite ATP-independent periplasmic transporter DctQ component n=1 Tax=Arcanobacterium haemolyticum (strain ATCC 9345 / DSM 20595 / CCM 5947 / CCUG 17215 / LMG 16163 / NBRC 15585 / NCTC 8452 / 11018) TaxID=644284 RepID=D7BP83_ARCHD|nr:TRAP transporter small permease [Arcanobacterium haemolyticum]ADH92732.1 Tripartite ATP-independent periplasmic transporter DctQ component [Arcanobacterium haemolyticum DSM 20595]QCX46836.1 TRAP transporter small permease [Arcanobacterium haemolyticum]SPT75151.1 2,3-diketo-L-gulonate TRAP transporter small permease protein yiaM [Arcanobacterium haemolyticum]SQH28527.1 2,3-diketo-L-gulonate TRAP transporter small permease protein yiaM [Arcanobacterium haemolyticum]